MTVLTLGGQSGVRETEITWPAKPEIPTLWPFPEKVSDLCSQELLPHLLPSIFFLQEKTRQVNQTHLEFPNSLHHTVSSSPYRKKPGENCRKYFPSRFSGGKIAHVTFSGIVTMYR